MEAFMNWWLTAWLYVIAFAGVVLAITLFIKWKSWTWLNRLGTLAVIVLVCHIWEEWVIPGGFHVIYNVGSPYPDRYPMSRVTDMITNFGGVTLGCIVLCTKGFKNIASIAIMPFAAFEVIIHIFLAFQSHSIYAAYGQTIIYAPGLITASFGFLPLTIGYVIYFIKHKPRPTLRQVLWGIVSLVCMSFLFVNFPELILKDKHSKYPFANKGYYERFTTHQISGK